MYKYVRIACAAALAAVIFSGCDSKNAADLIIYNAKVYTVDSAFTTTEAFAVKDGKILEAGSSASIREKYNGELYDAAGKAVYPGFIDGHTHFYRYGQGLQTVDLSGTESWDEITGRVKAFGDKNKEGWLIGRGWDQNDWDRKEFPDNRLLNELYPSRPVVLSRIDGHAVIANDAALKIAGISAGQQLTGGIIETVNGKLTGILVDNAVDLITAKIPEPEAAQTNKALLAAQKNCFAAGLTSVVDCGLDARNVDLIDALQKKGDLKMRMYVMLSDLPANYDYLFKKGAIKTDRLNVRSFKVYADGALGSRGASLLKPYTDKPNESGFLLSKQEHFAEVARLIADKGFQMCTHAIGDSANRVILKIYAEVLKGKNDRRWRIEHAQVINPTDFAIFGANSIIPSVQPTHATSDMYWAEQRLGKDRLKGAYAYEELLKQNGWLVLGTDFPVENINPMLTFSAAVVRKDVKGFPATGFQKENALSRADALRGMTIWAAKGSFEEKETGSIEKGKFADFVILDQDIMKVPENKIHASKVLRTYVNGEMVYQQ
jgi:predicted amidohydrolase YtcJ